MREWLCVFLVLVTASSAWASLVDIRPIPEGEPGSASNPLMPSDELVVLVYTDTTLVGLDCILRIESGPGCIVDALNKSTAPYYGYESGFVYDPRIYCHEAEIGAGDFRGAPGPVVGYFVVHCEGYGEVTATLTGGTNFGGSMDIYYGTPVFTGTITIYQVPEPMTIGLLGLGVLALLRRRKE